MIELSKLNCGDQFIWDGRYYVVTDLYLHASLKRVPACRLMTDSVEYLPLDTLVKRVRFVITESI